MNEFIAFEKGDRRGWWEMEKLCHEKLLYRESQSINVTVQFRSIDIPVSSFPKLFRSTTNNFREKTDENMK